MIFKPKENFAEILEDELNQVPTEKRNNIFDKSKRNRFYDYINKNNLSIDQAVAIYQYSINSNMMLGIQRGTATKESIANQLKEDFKVLLTKTIVPNALDSVYKDCISFMESLDYSQKPYDLDLAAKAFEKEHNYPRAVSSTVFHFCELERAEEAMKKVTDVLNTNELKEDIVLYRAVNSEYLKKDPKDMIGEIIHNKEATSTTYSKEGGFLKDKEMDLVYEISVPKGTKGMDIEPLSCFRKEKEVLLAEHFLKVKDYHYENGKIFLECDLIQKEKMLEVQQSDKEKNRMKISYYDLLKGDDYIRFAQNSMNTKDIFEGVKDCFKDQEVPFNVQTNDNMMVIALNNQYTGEKIERMFITSDKGYLNASQFMRNEGIQYINNRKEFEIARDNFYQVQSDLKQSGVDVNFKLRSDNTGSIAINNNIIDFKMTIQGLNNITNNLNDFVQDFDMENNYN